MTIDITIPSSWAQLTPKQLRLVYTLLQSQYSHTALKTRLFLLLADIDIIGRNGNIFTCKRGKRIFNITAAQVYDNLTVLDWVDELPQMPVRFERLHRYHAAKPTLENFPFGKYLMLDNIYQGYLQTQDAGLLGDMAQLLYDAPKRLPLNDVEGVSIFYWYASVKQLFARTFRNFFHVEEQKENAQTTYRQRFIDAMNTQIRALTGGDITKEQSVLEMDVWRALTELDAKARDYDELQREYKSHNL